MDFSYFQNIMEPNDFTYLNKFNKYDPADLFIFVNKYPKIIDLILEYFKANPKEIVKYIGICKSSLLMYAILYNTTIIKNICELDVNINYCNVNGCTTLIYAVSNNYMNAAKVLLEFDAHSNIVTDYCKTVFEFGKAKIKKNSQ